jgi:acetoin utilization protein AcuC
MHWSEEHDRNLALEAVERSIGRIRESIFPRIIGTYGATSGK